MRPKFHSRPSLEQLEDRCLPSLTVLFNGGNLFVYGLPKNGGVTVNQTAANQFQVMDGSALLGTYPVTKDITVRLGNSPDAVTVTPLVGAVVPGNVNVSTGNFSGDSVDVNGNGGQINGNLNVNTGGGGTDATPDFVNLSNSGTLAVLGSVNLTGTTGTKNYSLNQTLSVGGNVTAVLPTGNGMFAIGAAGATATVAGNLSISSLGTEAPLATVGTDTVVQGNLQYEGGTGTNTLSLFGTVNGNANIAAAGTTNNLSLFGSVGGNLTFADAPGSNNFVFFFLSSSIGGGATFNVTGSGSYFLQGSIGGNVSYNGTTGDTGTSNSFIDISGGSVGGAVAVHTGYQSDSLVLESPIGGPVTYTGGNAGNFVEVGDISASSLNVKFGSDTSVFPNQFIYEPGASVGSAYIDFGAGSTGDIYNDSGTVVVTWPQTIVNLNS